MKLLITLWVFFFCWQGIAAQDLTGRWEGSLQQEGKEDDFYLELNLDQNGDLLNGTSFSRVRDSETYARFELTGVLDQGRLILQEVRQLEPKEPRWCLKYATLRLEPIDAGWQLTGNWTAEGCTPGTMTLTRAYAEATPTEERELPFTMAGEWTGYLSQADRDYGFFYRFTLEEGGEGFSYIVSEDNGGHATHALNWTFDEPSGTLLVEESAVTEKTDPKWKWCIKTGRLRLQHDDHRYVLAGQWEGYLEGHTPASGACAPGELYLEKPVSTREVAVAQKQYVPYESESRREVKIERVLEVSRPNLRIKVWDNGVVDGDVITLFLNGEQLLHRYRVTKNKRAVNITLQEDLNFLILHAEDLGEIMPNTVAVSIDDGEKEQVLILSSNLRESGAVMIKQFKM